MANLFALPPELISLILTFVSVIDAIDFALVSRACRAWVISYLQHLILASTSSWYVSRIRECLNLHDLLVMYEGCYIKSLSGLTQLTMDTHGCHRKMSPVTQRERTEPLVYKNVVDYTISDIYCGQLNDCLLKIWLHLGYLPRYFSTGKSRCILNLCQILGRKHGVSVSIQTVPGSFRIVAKRFVCLVEPLCDGTYFLDIFHRKGEYLSFCQWWNDKYFEAQDQPHPLLNIICLFQRICGRPNLVLPLFKGQNTRQIRRKRAKLFENLNRKVDKILLGS